jgi:hypothetical protein
MRFPLPQEKWIINQKMMPGEDEKSGQDRAVSDR